MLNKKAINSEANIDFLICDDICVPEKALIKTNLNEIKNDAELYDWFLKVPSQILPVRASLDSEFINIRFSWPFEVGYATFFIDNQDIIEHAASIFEFIQNKFKTANFYASSWNISDGFVQKKISSDQATSLEAS